MDSDDYETSDLGLAAALLTYGIELVRINKDNPKRVIFVFVDSADTRFGIEAFWAGNLKLDVLSYFDSTKRLKSRIYGS